MDIEIPIGLVESIVEQRGVAFVGAGLSQDAGLPGWTKLLRMMLEWAPTHGIELSDYKSLEKCIEENKLLIAADDLKKQFGKRAFQEFITDIFIQNDYRPTNKHGLIIDIPFRAILTSNYDKLLETKYTIKYESTPLCFTHKDFPELSKAQNSRKYYILKVHGTIDRIETIVLGREDYREVLANQSYRNFLKAVFQNNTILFIGYGLNDPDLLSILDELDLANQEYGTRHYALVDTKNSNPVEMRSYSTYGIQTIPYTSSSENHLEVTQFLGKLENAVKNFKPNYGEKSSHEEETIESSTNFLNTPQIYEVKTKEDLCRLTAKTDFLENPLKNDEWKSKEKVVDFDDSLVTDSVNKLNTTRVLFITGPPNIGKSTFLLYFVNKCLENDCKIWDYIFFINPLIAEKEVDSVLSDIKDFIQKRHKRSNLLLVIDGLHRKESESNFVNKSSKIFSEVSSCGYNLIVTLRDSEKEFLKQSLGNVDERGIDEWLKFEPFAKEISLSYDKRKLKKILLNYINFYGTKIQIPGLSYKEIIDYSIEVEVPPEKRDDYLVFEECLRSVVDKSEGLAGYISFIIDDLSKNSGKFEKSIITEYPKGMVNLFWSTISRDYYIKGDILFPLWISFLKRIDFPVTKCFFDSFKEYGLNVLDDRFNENVKRKISDKFDYFLEFFTINSVFSGEKEYSLSKHWEFAINEAIYNGIVDDRYKQIVDEFIIVDNQWLNQVVEGYIDFLINGLDNPSSKYYLNAYPSPTSFYIVADIAKLGNVTRKDLLLYSSHFFSKYCGDTYKELSAPVYFLRSTLSLLWRSRAEGYMELSSYEETINSYENALKINPIDFRSYWGIGECYEKLDKNQMAIKYFTKSAYQQNTSKGYGFLISKLFTQYKKYNYNSYAEKLDNAKEQLRASMNALRCNSNYLDFFTLARALKLYGTTLRKMRNYSKAKECFKYASTFYQKSISRLEKSKPNAKIDYMYRDVAYCYLNLMDLNRILDEAQEYSDNLDSALIFFKLAVDSEKSNGGLLWLAMSLLRNDLYSRAQDTCMKALNNINISQLSEKETIEYYLIYGKAWNKMEDFNIALEYLSKAKKLIFSKYLDYFGITSFDHEEDTNELIDDIYLELGNCHEKKGDLDEAIKNYTIYLDLNEYSAAGRSGKLQGKFGKKFLNLKYYDESRNYLWQSLMRNPLNVPNLRALAHANMACGRHEEAIQNLKNCISFQESSSDRDDCSFCEKILERKKEICFILDGICEIADLSINNAPYYELSDAWYQVALDIEDILLYKELNSENCTEFKDLVISSLTQSIKINSSNKEAWSKLSYEIGQNLNATKNLFDQHQRKKYNFHYHEEKSRLFEENEEYVLRILNEIYSTTILTTTSYYRLNTDYSLNSKERKNIKRSLSHNWSKIGAEIKRINELSTKKISYIAGKKCCEISIKIREDNIAAWHHLGWACYYIGLFSDDTSYYEKAKEAFNFCINVKEHKNNTTNNSGNYIYSSMIGIGNVYEKEGDLLTAKSWFNDAINHKESNGLTEKNIDELLKTAKKIEYLRFTSTSKDEEIEFMMNALNIYSKALSIYITNNPSDYKTLLLDEKVRLLRKQILRIEKSTPVCESSGDISSSEDSSVETFLPELEELVSATSVKWKVKKIALQLIENSEDYYVFEELFRQEFSKHKFSEKLGSNNIESVFDELVSFNLKRATIDSPFDKPVQIFEYCQRLCREIYGEEQAKKLIDLFNDRVIPRFRKIFTGDGYKIGPVSSEDQREYVLAEFTRTFGKAGLKIPSLTEIEDEIKRSNTRKQC